MIRQHATPRPLMKRGAQMAGVQVPSGQPIELFEVLVDQVGAEAWLRFRFIATEVARGAQALEFDAVQADFEALCHAVALPYLEEFALTADVIVISLLDRPVAFGVADPDATQLIEAFRLRDGQCVWEGIW